MLTRKSIQRYNFAWYPLIVIIDHQSLVDCFIFNDLLEKFNAFLLYVILAAYFLFASLWLFLLYIALHKMYLGLAGYQHTHCYSEGSKAVIANQFQYSPIFIYCSTIVTLLYTLLFSRDSDLTTTNISPLVSLSTNCRIIFRAADH